MEVWRGDATILSHWVTPTLTNPTGLQPLEGKCGTIMSHSLSIPDRIISCSDGGRCDNSSALVSRGGVWLFSLVGCRDKRSLC